LLSFQDSNFTNLSSQYIASSILIFLATEISGEIIYYDKTDTYSYFFFSINLNRKKLLKLKIFKNELQNLEVSPNRLQKKTKILEP